MTRFIVGATVGLFIASVLLAGYPADLLSDVSSGDMLGFALHSAVIVAATAVAYFMIKRLT